MLLYTVCYADNNVCMVCIDVLDSITKALKLKLTSLGRKLTKHLFNESKSFCSVSNSDIKWSALATADHTPRHVH